MGRLGVQGNADLFLLNPNGIIFGENASLDVNGSFVSTIADGLYILLSGAISLSRTNSDRNPLTRIFAALEQTKITGVEISRLSKGEIIGESQFIDGELPYFTAQTTEHSQVLAISRQKLAVKLQQDLGFASRFHRTLAILFSDRLQEMLNRIGYSRRVYYSGSSLANNIEYDLELDDHSLEQISLAGQKFTWMLQRLENLIVH